jgi:hypothetical protein
MNTTVLNAAVLGGETQASALAIFTNIQATHQKALSGFDTMCGTSSSSAFNPLTPHSTCMGKHFVCGAGETDPFGQCLTAVDCQMHHGMAVSMPAGASKFATFARQMIAHHQNAVAMAKVLAKFHSAADYPPAGTEDQDMDWAQGLIRSIINVQNFQTQQMQGWLDANPTLAGTSSMCYSGGAASGSTCTQIKEAYRSSTCCGATPNKTTAYSVTSI